MYPSQVARVDRFVTHAEEHVDQLIKEKFYGPLRLFIMHVVEYLVSVRQQEHHKTEGGGRVN